MTREEFKAKVALAYGGRDAWEDFLEAVWQLHLEASNHWIPVEKELPAHEEYEDGLVIFPIVLVSLKDDRIEMDYYDNIDGTWAQYDGEVEYWMDLPAGPIKED